MYELVYDQMVSACLAPVLPESEQYWIDKNGEKVHSESDAIGMKVKIKITHPKWILFGDEVGTDISEYEDGHVGGGGQKFCCCKGQQS